uniref:Uncharacterized protein n=1 Tax=Neogobius melanostomus TaxID=47308 RepID=A0A8C6U7W0_9GOBI
MAQVYPGPSLVEEGQWSTALLDCFEDMATCCYGFWCGPCLACTVAGRMKEHYCLPLCDICFSGWGCVPPAAYGLRVAMRNRYKIKGSVLNDICVSWCCVWCSWCQMHRELKLRNMRPIIVNIQNVVSMQPAPMMGHVVMH